MQTSFLMDGQGDCSDFAHGVNSQESQLFILNITWQGLLTTETRNAVLQEVVDILDRISESSEEDTDNIDILQDSEIEVGAEVEVDMEAGQNVGGEEEQPHPEDIGIEDVHDGNVMNDPQPGGSRKRCREEDSDEEESSIRHAPPPPRDEEDEESFNMYRWSWNYSSDSGHYSESDTDSE